MNVEQIDKLIEELQGKAAKLADRLEKTDTSDSDALVEIKADQKSIQSRLDELEKDKEIAVLREDQKAMAEAMTDLTKQFEAARKPHEKFSFKGGVPTATEEDYGEGAKHSYFADVKAVKSGIGRDAALERLNGAEGKAMVEKDPASGGFLVPVEVVGGLLEMREAQSVARQLIPSQNVSTTEFQFLRQDSGLAVAWTAEQAEKISTDLSFSEFTVGTFTAAGLSAASNQLLADAKFSVDQLIFRDLAKRFVSLEAQAIYNGSGQGQPLGIINTPGVNTIALTSTAIQDLLDAIVDAITATYSTYFGSPTAIVMRPEVWGNIVKARNKEDTAYLIGAGLSVYGRQADQPLPGYGSAALPRGELFGYPVYTDPNLPANLGDAENESAIIVANWTEGLILDREGITTAVSEHVFFTSNQTVFRAEERTGFTAGRYPKAFNVIQGSGLASS